MASIRFTCPSCGWPGLDVRPYERWPDRLPVDALPPYEDEFGAPSYEVCLCCGFEFGNDDNPGTAKPESFETYRWSWVQTGAIWFRPTRKPDDWNLDRQLGLAGIDPLRRDLPRLGTMSGREFVEELATVCPEIRPVLDEHLLDNDGVLLHVLAADVRRFALSAFERSDNDSVDLCLTVVAKALTDGTDCLSNAIAVSFMEDTGTWDPEMADFIAAWPRSMRIEAAHQRGYGAGSTQA